MANSIVNVNLTLGIQDQTAISGSAGQSFLNRVVPTYSFASSGAAQYCGFQSLAAGSSFTVTPNQVFVAFIRVISGGGLVVQYMPGPGTSTVSQVLGVGGIWLVANPPVNQNISLNNWVSNIVAVAPNDGVPQVFEFLFAW